MAGKGKEEKKAKVLFDLERGGKRRGVCISRLREGRKNVGRVLN